MELIITEKPSSAKKIAEALGDGKPTQKKQGKVRWYELNHEGEEIAVVSAVGHLYTVAEKNKGEWTYPVFDVEWKPTAEVDKGAAFTKPYLTIIKRLAKKADRVTIATDFDIEGEVIGYTILRYAAERDDGERMKYSTVTKGDLIKSYENKMPTLAWGQAKAGTTRHELDWYYGINLSRALTLAVKAAGSFKLLSSGRVQTPALKILVDKEREIAAFKPEPFWQLEMTTPELVAMHVEDKFWKKAEAEKAEKNTTDTAAVEKIERRQHEQAPPHPFDLPTLQTEAYRSFRMSPKETLQHAQDLYSAGYISYPRTSSQQLPKEIGYEQILKDLQKQTAYADLSAELLKKKGLAPRNGKKTDPAHPAIYPTGVKPQTKNDRTKRVYDLVVRRFLATFSDPATRETVQLTLASGGEHYSARGTRTVEPGWHRFYGDHVKLSEEEMPALEKGQELHVKKLELLEKETQPPKRYTPSSIIKELEKQGLGTKATRADIVESLYNRGYVREDSIQATEIAKRTIDTLEKYVPEILDANLTKEIEEELERIREEELTPEQVLEHAKKHLTKLLDNFKEHEKNIGEELLAAQRDTQRNETELGDCHVCKQGKLQIRRGKYGLFVGCSSYPECKTTFPLPKGARFKPADKECEDCGFPLVMQKRKKSGWRPLCFNKECSSKDLSEDAEKRKEAVAKGDQKCPECGKALTVRSSAYGEFIGCSGYPKCRHTEQLETKQEAREKKEKAAEAATKES